jgi:type IV fimbrial biogenesis protein FimT
MGRARSGSGPLGFLRRHRPQAVQRSSGVTLIELLVGLAVLSLLLTFAVPTYRAWIENTRIRATAEALLSGMQLARTEAVRRNHMVELRLSGSSWTVEDVNTAAQLYSRSGHEGSKTASIAVLPAGSTSVTFNGMGWVTANADGTAAIAQLDVASSSMTGTEIRPLRVIVTPGGSMRMCDPAFAAPDPRACL